MRVSRCAAMYEWHQRTERRKNRSGAWPLSLLLVDCWMRMIDAQLLRLVLLPVSVCAHA